MKAAEDTIGEVRYKRDIEWFDEEYKTVIQEKNRNRQQILQHNTRSAHEKYRASRKNADKIIKKKYLNNKIKELEQLNKANENKKFYYTVKTMTNGYRARTTTIRDANGNLVKNEQAIIERWAEYFEEMLNKDNHIQSIEEVNVIEGNVPMSTLEEVEKQIKNQKKQ